ncbi:MAG: AsnC family transcriptional regulator [Thermodesulfobacteriota bacterium]
MDELDRKILNRIQSDFPITDRPYLALARELSSTEEEVIGRVKALKEAGIIRRIGGNFSPERVGYVSTLCAAKVPEEKLALFAETVNAYPGVTHNYQREHEMNVWFTFIAPSMEEIEKNLRAIEEKTGVRGIINLPATRVFKIRAQFTI